MKKVFALALVSFGLAACSSTWHGMKKDTSNNVEKTENGLERGWDKTKEAVRKGGNAVGRGMSHVGEKIENATE
ncbi:hypothetical protein ACG2K1_05960 [Neisseria sp. 23W00296]|uniref:hypothetical protein n=1 Tax=unclassified Neisseria TaxID=2623750 RepID=UPI0002A3FBD4|nr:MULTISPECIES: hypothetical protein [unclassified Neisseria]ASP17666.1 hypothetical protein CGZ77_07865 [Neisseria sp. KEM232]EKY08655.1 hypothetical protein HMPREF9120_00673 [Neisseria sp. oral taxon 020 str. F0370]